MGLFDKFNGKSKNFKYLEGLIRNGEKEIVLDSDIIFDSEEDSGSIILEDEEELIIDGNDHIINAKGKSSIFWFDYGCDITIKNITLKNAEDGAITNRGRLSLENSIFKNNKGGAIDNQGRLFVKNSIFKKNKSEHYGGAIDSGSYDCYASFDGCTFKNNRASRGGAIYAGNKTCRLSLKDCTFQGNKAKYGNALYVHMHR
ncbi:MAG: hypothetical protein E7Z73_06075 [Methanobrevibacter millerae]|uniref:Polymorphic outer membrane protein repeat-containing protein n=1 Tax=Methanobrevibacter millerae TaxID=230361 RepID=A0A8T3VDM8_9EURY|nr:hypothetical protein [Methanobrevibacter millerae]MBE6505292.1 hypothetical protein [Methanobrevibacter millerae]